MTQQGTFEVFGKAFGPPGTGKTKFLGDQIAHAADKFGTHTVLAMSYTRTASRAIAMGVNEHSEVEIPGDHIGTLHALCYHLLGKPPIAELHIDEWNTDHFNYRLTGGPKTSLDDPMAERSGEHEEATKSDVASSLYQIYRARMTPQSEWRESVIEWAAEWETWKAERGYIDFTDMIDKCREDFADPRPPFAARAMFLDEAQDSPANQIALFIAWAKHTDVAILAGDDDQTLYQHVGASPNVLLDIQAQHTTILNQSHRVPSLVQGFAQKWIDQVSRRAEKVYKPREAVGTLRTLNSTHKDTTKLLRHAEQFLAAGKSVMFLTSCGYMLFPLMRALKDAGIPFHNPYRTNRGDWNPLKFSDGDRASASRRIMAYLAMDDNAQQNRDGTNAAHEWTARDLALWMDLISAKDVLRHGAKLKIANFPKIGTVGLETVQDLFTDREAVAYAMAGDLSWFENHLLPSKKAALHYPLTVAKKRGAHLLRTSEWTPQVILGTIHSVKGGEADAIYLFPDLSRAGAQEWRKRGESRDAIIRQFYVGATRAKETLILCAPTDASQSVPLRQFLPSTQIIVADAA